MTSSADGVNTLPNRRLLYCGITLGWTLIASSLGLFLYWLWKVNFGTTGRSVVLYDEHYGYRGIDFISDPLPYDWYVSPIVLVVGIWLAAVAWKRYDRYYRVVLSGEIVHMDITGTHGTLHNVWLRGKTRAGETRDCRWTVPAGEWHHEYRKGMNLTFRDDD